MRPTELLHRPLPAPPGALRRGPFRAGPEGDADEPAPHDARTAALLGAATGIALLVCLLTGVISHLHQHPVAWLAIPTRPVRAYQVTQGLHVATGIALVPLVLAKLWVVYRRFFTWPPVRDAAHGLERLLLLPLVAGTLFQLVTGLVNIVQWYPWMFFFPSAHWAGAWIVTGAVLLHLGFKAPVLRDHLGRGRRARPGPDEPVAAGADRRTLLIGVGAAVGAVTLATAGQTVGALNAVSVLAPRRRDVGPQGLPVNRTARSAGVVEAATDPAWRLRLDGRRPVELSLAELQALPQHEVRLPIACVEGWSATGVWGGVRLRDVLALADFPADETVRVVSLERGHYQSSPVSPDAARDPLLLLALRLGGEPLAIDHGYPVRLIGPNRPGVLQTKWLTRIEIV